MATDIISEAPIKASAATTVEALKKQIANLTQQVEAFNLMALAAQNSDNAVIVTDRSARVEWVNDAFTRLTGYALRELKGRSPGSFLQSDETNPATIAYMRERIASGQPFEADIVNRRKDGAHYWARIEAKPILDAQGNVSHYMGIQRDITERSRTPESVIKQYMKTVRPMHLEFVEPSKRYADVIIPEGGFNTAALDMVVARLNDMLRDEKGTP